MRKMNKKKIIIFAGGTLGHVKPAISIYDELCRTYSVIFVTTENRVVKDYLKNKKIKNIFYLNCPGLDRKKLFKNIILPFYLIKSKVKIKKIIRENRPSLLIGFGGSISTIGLATFKKIPKIIHEQNAYEGLGNKIIRKIFNAKALSAFPINYYQMIGNPLITDYYNLKTSFNAVKNNVLIFGGSLGSSFLCTFFINNFDKIELFKDRNVIMITGCKEYNQIFSLYNRIRPTNLTLIKTTNEIEKYYEKTFFTISRAGAGTLSELIGLRIPALVIPSPNVTNNHQLLNAKYYAKDSAINYLEEKEVNVKNVNEKIREILNSKNKTDDMLINSKSNFIKIIKDVLGDKY